MPVKELLQLVGLVAGVVLPLWNIPLILKIRRRRSSQDISLSWTFGVFACLTLMLPSALISSDIVFKVFALVNIALFSAVVIEVVRYRK